MPEDGGRQQEQAPQAAATATPPVDPTGLDAVLGSLTRLYADVAEDRETLTVTLERDIGFRAAFECAADAALIVDDHGWCVRANPAAAYLLGIANRDELVGRRLTDIAGLDHQDQAGADWRHPLASGQLTGEADWQAADGVRRVLAFAARTNVRRGHHLIVLRDVTDRHRLRHERERDGQLPRREAAAPVDAPPRLLREMVAAKGPSYHALVHHDPELVVTIAETGLIQYANPAAERILGMLPEELQGKELVELIHPDDGAALRALLAYCRVAPADAGPIDARFLHRDGGWAWVEIVVRDLLDDPRIAGILVSGREVTARRRAEENRLLANERFARLFHAFPTGVAVTTLDEGRVIEVNDRFLALVGLARDEVIGRTTFDLGIWPDPTDRAVLVRRLQEHETIQDLEVRIATQRGEGRHAVISLSRVSLDGEPCLIIVLTDVTDRKNAEGRLHRLAHSDALTGLSNRPHFRAAVERAIDQASAIPGRLVAVLFIDLDRFKGVNDRFGHETGDRALEEVGRRLSASLRTGDLAARYGGDEFTILLPRLANEQEAAAVAERVIAALSAPYQVGEVAVSLSASAGIAVGGPGAVAGDLLREADTALYHAKARGRANYTFFRAGMRGASIAGPASGTGTG